MSASDGPTSDESVRAEHLGPPRVRSGRQELTATPLPEAEVLALTVTVVVAVPDDDRRARLVAALDGLHDVVVVGAEGSDELAINAALALAPTVTLVDVDPTPGFDGRTVSLVLADHGVVSTTVDQSVFDPEGSGVELAPSDAVVVPVAEWLEPEQLAALRALAERGATVVLAAQDGFSLIEHSVLTRTPAVPVRVGMCTVPALASLEAVDDVAHGSIDLVDSPEGLQRCFTGFDGPAGRAAVVTAEAVGSGRLVGLASPYVWANARLQPDKERGGEPLDNAAVAVGLLGGSGRVVFVRTAPGAGGSPDGTRNPLGLLPVNVELALVQLAAAFVVYAWWRGTRRPTPPGRS